MLFDHKHKASIRLNRRLAERTDTKRPRGLFAEPLEPRRVLASVVNAAPVVSGDVSLPGITDTAADETNQGNGVAGLFSSAFSDSAREDIQSLLGSRTLHTASLSQDTDKWLGSMSGVVAMNGYTYWLDGGITPYVKAALLGGVRKVVGGGGTYAAIRADGSLITWGDKNLGGDCAYGLYDGRISVYSQLGSGVVDVIGGGGFFAAKTKDGRVVVWGGMSIDGPTQTARVRDQALNLPGWWPSGATKPLQVLSNGRAFAGLSSDGAVCTWGSERAGGYSASVANELASGVTEVVPFQDGFIARKIDGRLIAWGDMSLPPEVDDLLLQHSQPVRQITGNRRACAARLADNRLVVWGDAASGGDASEVDSSFGNSAFELFAGANQFIALRADGVALSWGANGISQTVVGGTLAGVVVTASNALSREGVWQYRAEDSSWRDLCNGELSDSRGVFVDAASSIRFVPKANFNGSPGTLRVRVVEPSQLRLRSGDLVDASLNGGTTAISAFTADVGIAVQDQTSPTAALATLPGQPWRSVPTVMIEFSEPVTGVSAAALRLSLNGVPVSATRAMISGGPAVWSITNIAALATVDGSYTLSIGGQGTPIRDMAGNSLITTASQTFQRDTVRPTAMFVPVSPDRRNTSLESIALVFSEPVVGLSIDAFTLSRDGVAVSLEGAGISGDGTNWSLLGLSSATGANGGYQLWLNAGAGVTDLAGNSVMLSPGPSWLVDTTNPQASLQAMHPVVRNSSTSVISLSFTKPVVSVPATALRLTRDGVALPTDGVTVSGSGYSWTIQGLAGLTNEPGVYTVTLTGDQSGIFDFYGNELIARTETSWQVDTSRPTAAFAEISSSLRNEPIADCRVTFSEPVQDVGPEDFVLTRNGIPVSIALATVSGDAGTWTLGGLAFANSQDGLYALSLSDTATVFDVAGNPVVPPVPVSWIVDRTLPNAVFAPVTPTPRNSSVREVAVSFSEAVSNVTTSALVLTRDGKAVPLASATVTGSGSNWKVSGLGLLTGTAGSYVLTLKPSTAIRDAAGNPLGAVQASRWEHRLTVAFVRFPSLSPVAARNIDLVFNAPVTGFVLNQIQLAHNGGIVQLARYRGVALTGTGSRYVLTLPSSITNVRGTYVLSLGGPNSSITMGLRTLSQRFSVTWRYR